MSTAAAEVRSVAILGGPHRQNILGIFWDLMGRKHTIRVVAAAKIYVVALYK
jgi:hypothetical protein